MQLGRDGIGSDVLVMGGKRVPRKAERANPQSGANINLAKEVSAGNRLAEKHRRAYQKGFKTERQGCLQVTGSNWRSGVSGFSFRGV